MIHRLGFLPTAKPEEPQLQGGKDAARSARGGESGNNLGQGADPANSAKAGHF
jgi:hypothetical protein